MLICSIFLQPIINKIGPANATAQCAFQSIVTTHVVFFITTVITVSLNVIGVISSLFRYKYHSYEAVKTLPIGKLSCGRTNAHKLIPSLFVFLPGSVAAIGCIHVHVRFDAQSNRIRQAVTKNSVYKLSNVIFSNERRGVMRNVKPRATTTNPQARKHYPSFNGIIGIRGCDVSVVVFIVAL